MTTIADHYEDLLQDERAKYEAAEQEIQRLNEKVADLETRIVDLQDDNAGLRSQLEAAQFIASVNPPEVRIFTDQYTCERDRRVIRKIR